MRANHARERRRGRELVVQALYASAQTGRDIDKTLGKIPGWRLASEETRQFARMLIERLELHADEINRIIVSVVKHWDMSRIARVDDCIIRLAACEMLACPDIPVAVSINEAIDIAKKYSTEQSGRFVNGILDAIAAQTLTSVIHDPAAPDRSIIHRTR